MSDYWTALPADDLLDPKARYLLAALDRIEALGMQLADQRDELRARIDAATALTRRAITAASAALDTFDAAGKPRHTVHDHVVDTLASLRILELLLSSKEAPSTLPN